MTDHDEPTEGVMAHADDPPGSATSRVVRLAVGAVAAVLCLIAIPLPLWRATLDAPQYHGKGALELTAYGDRLVGDVCELNDLNHYIGMRRLGEPDIPCGSAALARGNNTVGRIAPEMILWIPGVLGALGAIALASTTRRQWLRRCSLVYLWGFPAGVLVMTQYHLYTFGHELDRTAAFHPKPFTPHVLGPSTIYQFKVSAWPGMGLILIILAAALVSFGPILISKFGPAKVRR